MLCAAKLPLIRAWLRRRLPVDRLKPLLDAYRAIPYLIDEEVIEGGAYMGSLLELYLFMLIGAVPTIMGSVKGRKLAKVTYRMQARQAVGSTPEL